METSAAFTATVSAITDAFGDPTRRSVYLYVRERGGEQGATVSAVADEIGVHPNVARHHLDKLAAGGYLEVHTGKIPGGGAGRPSKRYLVVADAVTEFPVRSDDLVLSLLGRALTRLSAAEAEAMAEEVGAEYGRALAAGLTGDSLDAGHRSVRSAIQAVADALTAHGFAAHAESRNNELRIINDHCPFGEVAVEHPVICAVDRGMVRAAGVDMPDHHSTDRVFAGSVPEIYDRYLVPMIFEPYADDLAQRLGSLAPGRVLEVAAGSGVATRAMATGLPADSEITATDLNPGMIDRARAVGTARPVRWQQADVVDLPFDDGSFDAVVCQFSVMFFPNKVAAFAEVLRVLRPGGMFLFNVWDRIERNEFADVVTAAVGTVFPDDPPMFLARTPHGYHAERQIRSDLAAAGFRDTIGFDAVARQRPAPIRRSPIAREPRSATRSRLVTCRASTRRPMLPLLPSVDGSARRTSTASSAVS